jgi:hypothetical protein
MGGMAALLDLLDDDRAVALPRHRGVPVARF